MPANVESWGNVRKETSVKVGNMHMSEIEQQNGVKSVKVTLEGKHGIGCRIWFSVEEGRRKESAAAWWRCCENLVGATPLCATRATSAVASNRH